jgi:hypothetical protein
LTWKAHKILHRGAVDTFGMASRHPRPFYANRSVKEIGEKASGRQPSISSTSLDKTGSGCLSNSTLYPAPEMRGGCSVRSRQ